MKQIMVLALMMSFLATAAQAITYDVYAYDDSRHAVWIPGLDQRNLLLDPGATLSIEDDLWQLDGALTSASDGSKWWISATFSGVSTGLDFGAATGYDDGRIKGATWADIQPDWAFAENVSGVLTANDGIWAGHSFAMERNPGSRDYYAQFGTCMNDKNCEKGLSTWLSLTDTKTGESYRGDINVSVSAPVPEPSAALVFGLGMLLTSASIRRRSR